MGFDFPDGVLPWKSALFVSVHLIWTITLLHPAIISSISRRKSGKDVKYTYDNSWLCLFQCNDGLSGKQKRCLVKLVLASSLSPAH